MARFRGTVQGGRGEASRLGHNTSGLLVYAQSYSGDVYVRLFDKDDEDWVTIGIKDHYSSTDFYLYRGPVSTLLNKSARATLMQALAVDMLTEGAAA